MEERSHRLSKTSALCLYLPAFYCIWILWEFWVRGSIGSAMENQVLAQFVKSGLIKNLVWTLPAILLIRYFQGEVAIPLKEMFSPRVPWRKYLSIFLAFTLYVLAGSFLQNGALTVSREFDMEKVVILLFVGLTEETVFRGWLLNATVREDSKWPAILLNTLLFLAIHFPKWLHAGEFLSNFTNLGFVSVLAMGVIFSLTFLQSRRLWVPIALHMYWDLLVFLFL